MSYDLRTRHTADYRAGCRHDSYANIQRNANAGAAKRDERERQMSEQIAELELRVATLENQVRSLLESTTPPRVATQPAPEPQVRIFHPADITRIELPNEAQLHQLAKIVTTRYPQLGPDTSGHPRWHDMNIAEWDSGFRAAFRRVACLNRTDEFNVKRDIRYFADEAMDYLRAQGMPTDIRWPCYLAAVIAAGDVPFSIEGPYVGLRFDGIGRPATAAWRDILQGRALR